MYKSVYDTYVMLRYHFLNPVPAKFSQCLGNMFPVAETGNNSGPKVDAFLEYILDTYILDTYIVHRHRIATKFPS